MLFKLDHYIFAVGLFSIVTGHVAALADESRPNILWITCEDLSPRLSCYGDDTVPTPNIDGLCAQGIRFTNAFGVYGVCAPNRHCIIMGMYPTTTGGSHMRTWKRSSAADEISRQAMQDIPLYEATPPIGAKCFTEYLRAQGYYCTNRSKTDYQFMPPKSAWDQNGGKAHWRNRPDKKMPFFSVFNFGVTHESGTFEQRSPQATDPNAVAIAPYYPDTPVVRRDIARHYDNLIVLDQQVGKILSELEEDQLDDQTIVFFFSDHGDGLPRAKRWVYDSGLKVPLLVRYPDGKNAGKNVEDLVSFVDLAPTILSLCQTKVPDHMHGQIFLGPQKAKPRKYIYGFRDRMDASPETIRAVRDKRFKYIRNYRPDLPYFGHIPYRNRAAIAREIIRLDKANKLGPNQWQFTSKTKPIEELYDCQTDPYEIKNLIDDPAYSKKSAELRQAHQQWNQNFSDLGQIDERELIKKLWPPNGVQPVTASPLFEPGEQGLQISSPTPGASIVYKLNNQHRWLLYTKPIEVAKGTRVSAIAHRIGFKESKEMNTVID